MPGKREKGFIALTSVLIIGAIVLILAISLFHSALTDYSISTAYESGQQAAFLADFCLKEGVIKLQEDINYIGGEEIGLSNATCTINFVKQINENTKEISSLGRTGDQPHFSRASQQIRYIIEPGEDGWLLEGEGAELENIEISGNSLKLSRPEAEVVTRTIDTSGGWADYYDEFANNVAFTEDGSLILAATEPPPSPEEPSLDCGAVTESSIEIIYQFSNASDARLYRDLIEIARLGSGTRSDKFIDTGLDSNTSYLYTLKDEGIDLATATCSTKEEIKKADGESCENPSECQSGYCYNNICCLSGEICCSSDGHCPSENCSTGCQYTNHYCDTTTDHYCKSTTTNCDAKYHCSDSGDTCSCVSGSCDTSPTCDKICDNGICRHQNETEDKWGVCSSQQSSCPSAYLNLHSGSCDTVCGNLSYRTGNCNGSGGCETGCTCYEIGTDSGGTNGHYCSYICKAHLGCHCTSGETGSCSSNLGNKSHSCECEGRTYEANWTFCRCK